MFFKKFQSLDFLNFPGALRKQGIGVEHRRGLAKNFLGAVDHIEQGEIVFLPPTGQDGLHGGEIGPQGPNFPKGRIAGRIAPFFQNFAHGGRRHAFLGHGVLQCFFPF